MNKKAPDKLPSEHTITVITPLHTPTHDVLKIRQVLSTATIPVQFILVLDHLALQQSLPSNVSNDLVICTSQKGRGFAFRTGLAYATGDIVLLLHSDTIPPKGWDQAIIKTLSNPRVAGGGFSMNYDLPHPLLTLGIWLVDQWFRLSGELYGDRALFCRTQTLRQCSSVLQVPLFEDVRLIKYLQARGKIVLLKDTVQTSTHRISEHGFLNYIRKFITCRLWYSLGGSPEAIFNAYYPSH